MTDRLYIGNLIHHNERLPSKYLITQLYTWGEMEITFKKITTGNPYISGNIHCYGNWLLAFESSGIYTENETLHIMKIRSGHCRKIDTR
jgi:hypothetical protein